jgi:peptidyl-prolyl cis-trans isomerase D
MLQTIREKLGGKAAAVILMLVAVPFVLWGTYSYFDKDARVTVARVNGTDIGTDRYRSLLEQQRRSAQQSLGKAYDARLFDHLEFKLGVLERLIEDVLLASDAHDQGYRVGDAHLGRVIRQEPQFQRNGQFDPRQYEILLRRLGLNARGFEARLRGDLTMRQAASGFSEGALVDERELESLLALRAQRREVAWAHLAPGRFLAEARVGASEIQSYYEAHADQYRTPERARIQYLRLAVEDLAARIRPSEDELRQAYAEQAGLFTTPERRRASHLLIATAGAKEAEGQARARIEELRKQLLAGAEFAALARQHSEDAGSAASGGDLGVIERGAFPPEFEQALRALKPGEISKPVRSSSGWHLIKLTEFTPEVKKSFAEARPQLEKETRRRRAEEQFYDQVERFRTLVYEQADSLEPAAKTLGLSVAVSDWFTSASGTGIAAEPKVREATFDPEVIQGRNSPALELGTDTVVALRVLQHEPARLKPLAEVRPEIEQALRRDQARREAKRAGEELLARVRAGERLETAATRAGAVLSAPRWMSRREAQGLDGALVQALFQAARPEAGRVTHGGVELTDGGYTVFALLRVEEGRAAQVSASERAEIRRLLEARRGPEFYAAYRNGLRSRADVSIHRDQL